MFLILEIRNHRNYLFSYFSRRRRKVRYARQNRININESMCQSNNIEELLVLLSLFFNDPVEHCLDLSHVISESIMDCSSCAFFAGEGYRQSCRKGCCP